MPTETAVRNVSLARRDLSVAIILGAITLTAGLTVVVLGVCGIFNDDAVYVSTAKALAEGRGYRLISLPLAPYQTQYPILYPAVLAVIWLAWPVFPDNLIAMQGLTLVLSAMVIGLGYLFAVRVQKFRPLVAGLALALCATSPIYAYFSTQTLSEIPFALCLIVALWVVADECERPSSFMTKRAIVGFAIAIPCLVRLIGFAIVAPLLFLLWRRTRRVVAYTAGALLPLTAWLIWVIAARRGTGAMRRALNSPDSWDWLRTIVLHQPWRAAALNGLTLTFGTVDFLPTAWHRQSVVVFIILGIVTWIGVARRGRLHLPSVLLPYVFVALIWPWPSGRFLVPLWPVLSPFVLDLIPSSVGAVPLVLVATLALGQNIIELRQASQRNRESHYPTLPGQPAPPAWRSFERTFRWITAHTNPGDVAIAVMDPMVFLYTHRTTMRPFDLSPLPLFYAAPGNPVGTLAEFEELLGHSRHHYLVRTALLGFAEGPHFDRLVEAARQAHPACLSLVYRDEQDSRFEIFAIDAARCRLGI